jgi:glucose/arabinose dehydrogenase
MRLRFALLLAAASPAVLLAAASCGGSDTPANGGPSTGSTGEGGAKPVDAGGGPCGLPGTVQFTAQGAAVVPGGLPICASGSQDHCQPFDLRFLSMPTGFCAHYFASVGNARQLRFAPGGDLFVASPTTLTTGGGPGGVAGVVVLPQGADGYAQGSTRCVAGANSCITFMSGLPSTQGLLFANDSLYFQDAESIFRVPYAPGDHAPSAARTLVASMTAAVGFYSSATHWPKTLDVADDGTIYVGNGGDQQEACVEPHPFHGGIAKVGTGTTPIEVAKGFRNPIAVRCAKGHDQCFAIELAKDYSNQDHGREKMIAFKQGEDWGFPCCASANTPYTDTQTQTGAAPSCGGVSPESEGFVIGDTPFGVAFEPGKWPAPWTNDAFVVLHGVVSTWIGARVVAVKMDPSTGLPVQGSDFSGSSGGMTDFATGWDDGTLSHGRPAAVDFSDDGRLYVANDNDGSIIWIAPL